MKAEKKAIVFYPIIAVVLIFLSGVVLEIALSIFIGVNNNSRKNNSVMFLFFVIVAIIFAVALKFLIKGSAFVLELRAATRVFNEEFDKNKDDLLLFAETNKIFNDEIIAKVYDEFLKEVKQSRNYSSEANVNIEDYINEGLACRIIKAHYLNQVAGTMTAIGILGTFLGLTMGLNSFDLSGSAIDIANKVEPLMNGIKVAFHTSICGMTYSILFGFFYRRYYMTLINELEKFLSFFEEKVVCSYENGSPSTLFKYQERLCGLLEEQNRLQKLNLEQTRQIASEEYIEKIVNRIEPAITEISTSVLHFTDKAMEAQLEGLKAITNQFLKQLNAITGESFLRLSELIGKNNKAQTKHIALLEQNYSELSKFGSNIKEINEKIENSINCFSAYCNQISNGQEKISVAIDVIKQQTELSKLETKAHSDFISSVEEREQQFEKNISQLVIGVEGRNQELMNMGDNLKKSISDLNILMNETNNTLKAQYDAIIAVKENSQQSIIDVKEDANRCVLQISERVKEKIHEVEKDSIDDISKLVEELKNTLKRVDSIVENMPTSIEKTNENIDAAFMELKVSLDGYMEYADKLSKDVVARWNKLNQYKMAGEERHEQNEA